MWGGPKFMHFYQWKHDAYMVCCPLILKNVIPTLLFNFSIIVNFIYFLVSAFWALITYTVPCLFIYGVHKRHYYICVSTWRSENIGGTLFVVCLFVILFFVPFSYILTCKYINHTYPFPVYIRNTPSTPYCMYWTAENFPLTFGDAPWLWKHQSYICSDFETSKYVWRYLVYCLFAGKYVISAVFKHFNL